jgi:hypothetical protein
MKMVEEAGKGSTVTRRDLLVSGGAMLGSFAGGMAMSGQTPSTVGRNADLDG